MCWRRPRSLRTGNPWSSSQGPGDLGLVGTLDRGVRYSARWMKGFTEHDNAFPVREQNFNALKSRRPKISQRMSSGRLRRPLSYVIVGRSGAGGRGGVIAGLGSSPNNRSRPNILEMFPIRIVSPELPDWSVRLYTHISPMYSPSLTVRVNRGR